METQNNKKQKKPSWIKSISVKYILLFVIAFAAFLEVIIMNYGFITSEIKDRVKSQMMFESFQESKSFTNSIEQCTDAVKFTADSLEKMMNAGASSREAGELLTEYSRNYKNVIGDTFNGFYCYYKGEEGIYDDDYTPNRSVFGSENLEWYNVAAAAKGDVALSQPYKDEQTGKIIITASLLLSDGKTVLADDFTIEHSEDMGPGGDGVEDEGRAEKRDNDNNDEKPPEEDKSEEKSESTSYIIFATGYIISADDDSERSQNIFDNGAFLGNEEDIKAELLDQMPRVNNRETTIDYGGKEYDINIRMLYDKIYIVNAVNNENAMKQQLMFSIYEIAAIVAVMMILAILLYHISKKNREAKRLDEERRRAQGASEAKSAFLSNMSHEIRTPINAVLGMNEMVLRECDDDNILAYSESIKTAGNTLLGIINDILDFSKIEAGKMEIIPVDYDLSSVLNDLVNMVQTRADAKGLLLELEFAHDTPHYLNGDEIRIKQVITNILTNAVKYTKEGSITFTAGYERIENDDENIMLNIAIKDTGIGIKKEDLSKLFSEFERIEEERNRNIEGTGLGMNITRSLLDMMGSTLHVESTYGKGSRFSFSLKQKVIKWDPLGDYESTYRSSISARQKYKEAFTAPQANVLVVDDTPMNLMVFKSLLKQTGIKIDTANSGDEGISAALEHKYDLIFLDHMMPHKDGIQTLKEMKEEKNNPNIDTIAICLTANAISGAREKYLAAGFDDYLTKPIDPHKLEEMLIHYLPDDKILYTAKSAEEEQASDNSSIIPDFVADISEIDIQAGIRNCGNEEIYLETLKTYANMADSYIREIQEFYDAEDIPNTTVKIHALKSTSRIIGAVDLGETAQQLENAGNANDRKALDDNMDEFLERCRRLWEKLSPFREQASDAASENASDLPQISDDEYAEVCTLLKDFAASFDSISIESVLDDLKGYRLNDEQKQKIDQVRHAADELEFEKIPEILQ